MSARPESAARDSRLPAGYELRALHDADAPELHAVIERNRARLARWIHWAHEQTPQDTHAFIGRACAMEQDGSGLSRGVVAAGRLAGVVGISVDHSNRSGAIGYWLDEASEGKGAITAAVAAIADDGFRRYRLVRVEIRADVDNRASRAVAERLGFRLEGVLRQSYRVSDEQYSDDAVYSLLASDPARRALS
ncbi:MAG TPA: GNAT family protein [Solirubrobacteraceae bacterium]|nr:GNAT family protein [Solirubrobacteraceae bacterium]